MTSYQLINGNSLDVLKTLPDNSVDAIVTDPPYGLSQHSQADIVNALTAWLAGEEYTHGKAGFMGKDWDSFVPSPMLFKECLRVLKPGGNMLCFAGARTQDLMGIAIRLAGFELRDNALFLYGSGFPKGCNIAKGIDKALGIFEKDRPVIGKNPSYRSNEYDWVGGVGGKTPMRPLNKTGNVTPEAKRWEGWNTNIKPAYEPIIMARKPLDGTVVNNVLKHGVGGLNIDACRVESDDVVGEREDKKNTQGRYPANVILDGSDSVEALFPYTKCGDKKIGQISGGMFGTGKSILYNQKGSEGSASRYFYHAKASKRDRDEGLESMNGHPTVKNTALMRHLVRLVTPKGGIVLDPFMGSGSTGKACMYEGMQFIGIELNPEYIEIAKARIEFAKGDADATE